MVDSTKAGAEERKKKPAIDGISFRRFAVPDIGSTTRDLMDGQADSHSACFGLTRESCGATESGGSRFSSQSLSYT